MKEYSETVRARMVARLLGPRAVSASALSKESGISQATLSRWLKAAATIEPVTSRRKRQRGAGQPGPSEEPAAVGARRSGADKLALVERAAGLDGETLGAFLRREGVHLAELEQWRKLAREALSGTKRQAPSKELRRVKAELARKEKALAETAALIVLKKKSGGDLGGRGRRHGTVQRRLIIELIDEAVADGAGHGKACGTVGIAPTTIKRWRANPDAKDARRGPVTRPRNALSERERADVVAIMTAPEHSSMSPDTLVPYLATLGMYLASQSTFYRIARATKLLHARGRARRRSHRRPRECVSKGPNQVWAWDITFLPTTVRGRFLKLYVIIDVWSRMIVGAEVHEHEDDALAAKLVEGCCSEQGVAADELVLHADNGGAMKGNTMLAKLQQLGVMSSFSRPNVSDDNAFAESVMRTIKYCPAYPEQPFADLAAAREWVASFVLWYNEEHLHSGIGFVTPSQRHAGDDVLILAHRHAVYTAARERHPERWTGNTRNWARPETVILNPSPASRKQNASVS